jgi:hypothetical protein
MKITLLVDKLKRFVFRGVFITLIPLFVFAAGQPVDVSTPSSAVRGQSFFITFDDSQEAGTAYELWENGAKLTGRSEGPIERIINSAGVYIHKMRTARYGYSAFGAEDTITIKPPTPSTLDAHSVGNDIVVDWGVIGDEYYLAIKHNTNSWSYGFGPYTGSSKTFENLALDDSTRSYMVMACSNDVCSDYSNISNGVTLTSPKPVTIDVPSSAEVADSFFISFDDSQPSGTSYRLYENGVLLTSSYTTPIERVAENVGSYTYKMEACRYGCSDFGPEKTITIIEAPKPLINIATFKSVEGYANFDDAVTKALESNYRLYFPAGTYNLTKPITPIGSQFELVGDGAAMTIIHSSADPVIDLSSVVVKNHVVINNLKLTNGKNNRLRTGIQLSNSNGSIELSNLHVRDFDKAIVLKNVHDALFDNIKFNHNNYGIYSYIDKIEDQLGRLEFSRLVILNEDGVNGVKITGSEPVCVSVTECLDFKSSTFERAESVAMYFENVSHVRLTNTYFESNSLENVTNGAAEPIIAYMSGSINSMIEITNSYFNLSGSGNNSARTGIYAGKNTTVKANSVRFSCNEGCIPAHKGFLLKNIDLEHDLNGNVITISGNAVTDIY